MADLCIGLSRILDREIIDKTCIEGAFDIRLDLSATDLFPLARRVQPIRTPRRIRPDPQSLTALQKLGLKLDSGRGRSDILVIDHVERPSEN